MPRLAEQYIPLAKQLAREHRRKHGEREPGECLSDAYLALVESETKADRNPGKFGGLATRAIEAKHIDSYRRQVRYDRPSALPESGEPASDPANPDLADDVRVAMDRLSPEFRTLAQRIFFEGQPLVEAGRSVGIKHGSQMTKEYQFLLSELRRHLKDYE